MKERFVPMTPAGTVLMEFAARTEELAWQNLEKATTPGMYRDRVALMERGYAIGELQARRRRTKNPK
jgi:hypothetical protein